MERLFAKIIETMPGEARGDVRALQSKIVYLPTGGTKSSEDIRVVAALKVTLDQDRD